MATIPRKNINEIQTMILTEAANSPNLPVTSILTEVVEVLVPALAKLFTGDYKSCWVYLKYRIAYTTLPTFIKPYYDAALQDVELYIAENYS